MAPQNAIWNEVPMIEFLFAIYNNTSVVSIVTNSSKCTFAPTAALCEVSPLLHSWLMQPHTRIGVDCGWMPEKMSVDVISKQPSRYCSRLTLLCLTLKPHLSILFQQPRTNTFVPPMPAVKVLMHGYDAECHAD